MKIQHIVLLFATMAAAACSNNDVLFQHQRVSPPTSAKDVGIVVSGAQPEEVQSFLQSYPEAQVRVVSQPHGIYEFFGMSHAQVQEKFPNNSEPNRFTPLRAHKHQMIVDSVAIPAGAQVGNLKPCTAARTGPTAVLSASKPSATLDHTVIELGQAVTLDGLKSTSATKGALNYVFDVEFPETSPTPEGIHNGSSVTFTPDTMGIYKVAMMVQDATGACAGDMMEFIVTAQRPYNGPNVQPLKVDLTKFTHLAMVHAQDAWKVSQGKGIIIAIVDTGVDYNHPALAPNILVNSKEIPSNGIDDDKNGFIDDYLGYNFAYQNPIPYDDDSHGTHVSGLAAATPFGLAPQAKILAVKTMTPAGGDDATIAAGVLYAVDRGANIINLSVGSESPGGQPSSVMMVALQYARSKGVLVLSAAGNGDAKGNGINIDQNPEFPASIVMDNNLAVAAFSSKEAISNYSNYGVKDVGVCAPGGDDTEFLFSAAFENPANELFVGMSGTSMATPVVAGIAADVWSKNPKLGFADVKAILMKAGTDVAAIKAKVTSGKHIDALSAVQAAGN